MMNLQLLKSGSGLKMKQLSEVINGLFGRLALPRSVRIMDQIEDCPEVKVGYVYTYQDWGYYEGPTCKVFMPYRIKRLIKENKVEVTDGKIIICGSSGNRSNSQSCELAA
jgi:hypothetical protein